MKVTADDRKRVVLPAAKPGDCFDLEVSGNKIVLTRLVLAEVPVVKPRRVNGSLRWPEGLKPTREQIAAAVRADRDSR